MARNAGHGDLAVPQRRAEVERERVVLDVPDASVMLASTSVPEVQRG